MTKALSILTGLLLLACSLSAADKPAPAMPDMRGPTTCVALYEQQAAGGEALLGYSLTPSYKGPRAELAGLMPTHIKHAIQLIGRTHGKSEAWLAEQAVLEARFVNYSPDYTKLPAQPDQPPQPICWCATSAWLGGPSGKGGILVGCDFPCGDCEHCVIPTRP